jgi:(2Fe-2S) ferredoxin
VVYVVVCRGPHCRERGSLPLRQRLVRLLRDHPDARLIGYACFGQCEQGPNVAFYPEGTWFGRLDQPDAAERVVEHATRRRPLEAAPLRLPEAERGEHLRNIAELVALHERERAGAAVATSRSPGGAAGARRWWPFGRR